MTAARPVFYGDIFNIASSHQPPRCRLPGPATAAEMPLLPRPPTASTAQRPRTPTVGEESHRRLPPLPPSPPPPPTRGPQPDRLRRHPPCGMATPPSRPLSPTQVSQEGWWARGGKDAWWILPGSKSLSDSLQMILNQSSTSIRLRTFLPQKITGLSPRCTPARATGVRDNSSGEHGVAMLLAAVTVVRRVWFII